MKIHSVSFEAEMRILEFDLKTLRNFERINNDLEKDILLRGDEQNKNTNVKAIMTSWQMADQYKSFQDLLKIIVKHILPKWSKEIYGVHTINGDKDMIVIDCLKRRRKFL